MRAACALLCCLTLASCGEAPTQEPAAPPAAAEPGSVPTEEAPEEEPPAVDEEFARVVEAAAPFQTFGKASVANVQQIPAEEKDRLLMNVAALGVPVRIDWWDERGIEGWQAIAEFCEASRRGEDAEVVWYGLDPAGVTRYRLAREGGKRTRERLRWYYGEPAPEADSYESELLSGVEFWENGWLVWDKSGMGAERIVPLPKEFWGPCEKYVIPVAGDRSDILRRDWDTEDYSSINWQYVFISLSCSDGEQLFEVYEPVEELYDAYEAPAADVEGLLTEYFPVTVEELCATPQYQPDTQTYWMQYFQGTGNFVGGILEVAGKTDNPDGSMTLQVDWVCPNDRVERYYLTVLPEADGGWRYLGNRVDPEIEG